MVKEDNFCESTLNLPSALHRKIELLSSSTSKILELDSVRLLF